jgi:hypothetical protein
MRITPTRRHQLVDDDDRGDADHRGFLPPYMGG